MICAAAQQFDDWTATYRMLSKERIDRPAFFAPARQEVIERLKPGEPLVVIMDDTLIRKRGRKIPGAGWKRDPLGPAFHANLVWSQRFLQISAALPDEHQPGAARAIPIDFIHAPCPAKPKKKDPPEVWAEYRRQQAESKVSAVASNHLHQLRQQIAEKTIICSVDGGFTNQTVFRNPPDDTILIGRIRKDARLFRPPDAGEQSGRGRKRFYGQPLPTPEEIRKDNSISWQQVQAYASGRTHQFDVKHLPAVRWKGTGDRSAQALIIRPLAYRPRKGARLLYRNPVYLICTDPHLSVEKILQSYLWRWEIELNFRDEKTVFGVGQAQVRNDEAVEMAPALGVAAYSYLLLAGTAVEDGYLPLPKWRNSEPPQRTTTQMMQNLFRSQLWSIALENNKTHFADSYCQTQTQFFSQHSLNHAACYAFK